MTSALLSCLRVQVKCKANAEPSPLELCWTAAFTRRCISNASAKVQRKSASHKLLPMAGGILKQQPPDYQHGYKPLYVWPSGSGLSATIKHILPQATTSFYFNDNSNNYNNFFQASSTCVVWSCFGVPLSRQCSAIRKLNKKIIKICQYSTLIILWIIFLQFWGREVDQGRRVASLKISQKSERKSLKINELEDFE